MVNNSAREKKNEKGKSNEQTLETELRMPIYLSVHLIILNSKSKL